MNIRNIDRDSPLYPSLLKLITDPPESINCAGDVTATTFTNCIGIVGTRNITPYGTNVVSKFVSDLANFDCTFVSGLTRGVDTAVHEMCLKKSVKTIAILPFGLNYNVNKSIQKLITEITRNTGVVVSEYPDTFEPKKWSFVRRNRLIAGVSKAILVVEAAEASGSLLTAGFARKYKRPVYVVPGNIFSPYSAGIYKLLFSGASAVVTGFQLAKLLSLPILPELTGRPWSPSKAVKSASAAGADFSAEPLEIINALRISPMNVTNLSAYLGLEQVSISKCLMSLLLYDKVFIKEGVYYVKEN